jgi:CRISPR-associated protein Cas1
VEGKIRNSRTFLRRNARVEVSVQIAQLKGLADKAATAATTNSLLGIEGTAARIYFSQFAAMLRVDSLGTFDFTGRNRRPPRDPVNCLLSFAYSLLVRDLTATMFGVGLDPYLGVYHRPRFGRPALALDLAEEFRPLIAESAVVNAINNGEVTLRDFMIRAQGVALTQNGRTAMIRAHERRLDHEITHPVYGYRITYRRVLEVQARMLAAHFLGEIPKYVPFVTR